MPAVRFVPVEYSREGFVSSDEVTKILWVGQETGQKEAFTADFLTARHRTIFEGKDTTLRIKTYEGYPL
jgi:hypothetical protein